MFVSLPSYNAVVMPGPQAHVETFYKRSAGAETSVAMSPARLALKVGWTSRLGVDSRGRYFPKPCGGNETSRQPI